LIRKDELMADENEPMQADGTDVDSAEHKKNPPSAGRPDMNSNAGESGGGAYPSPHNDPANADPQNTFLGHGGESDMGGMGDSDEGPDEKH
jgi:hypothetical protein